ncbi:alpha/beta hydrolase [Metapseudomonas furukawaii]|uniref:alpha/beta fold hydrolase n=1 Tax=Metapseudomonas furukawaii TaxID=1149133 RepID=UPI00227BB26B|nr:alpha/beta hydrolase [Pseudomonas furukawaii]WAG81324.1 alpha/beta hydrolase [Pseudomonas furukawaii]
MTSTSHHTQDLRVDSLHGRLFVRIWSPDHQSPCFDQAPIVLFHDSLGCVELWRDFPARLAAATGKAVVAYDRLGFGRSDPHPDELTFGFIADEAERAFPAVKDQLGIDDFIAFGHSVGGAMATLCADRHRMHCHALITVAAQAFVEEHTLEGIRVAKDNFRQPEQLQRLVKYHGDKARWVLDAWTETWLSPAYAHWTLEEEIQSLDCPLLVVHGDQDEFGSRLHPQRIVQLTEGPSRLLLMDDCGHVPHREKPEAVLAAVADFLR